MSIYKTIIMAITGLLFISCAATPQNQESLIMAKKQALFKKATSVLLTHDVEACVLFWAGFGLRPMVEVPGEDGLSFVILKAGNIEIMYQSFASAAATNSDAIEGINRSSIYLEVTSLDKVLPIAESHDVIIPEHVTFYGAREIYIRDPAGNLIGFAEQEPETS